MHLPCSSHRFWWYIFPMSESTKVIRLPTSSSKCLETCFHMCNAWSSQYSSFQAQKIYYISIYISCIFPHPTSFQHIFPTYSHPQKTHHLPIIPGVGSHDARHHVLPANARRPASPGAVCPGCNGAYAAPDQPSTCRGDWDAVGFLLVGGGFKFQPLWKIFVKMEAFPPIFGGWK